MDKKFFIADLHFGHKNILTLANRRFSSVEEHDNYVISCINAVVDKGDLLYILGDLGYRSDKEKLKEKLLEINTRNIHVIKGNHDKLSTLVEFKRMGIIADVKEYAKVQHGKDTIVCFHYPIKEWEGYYRGWYHAYGHCIDTNTEILTDSGWKSYFNISKEDKVINFNPKSKFLELDDIEEIIQQQYTGRVYSFTFMGVDMRVTNKHRIFIQREDSSFEFMEADDFYNVQENFNFVRSGILKKRGMNIPDKLLKLYAWLSLSFVSRVGKDIKVRFFNELGGSRFEKLLKDLHLKYCKVAKSGSASYSFDLPTQLQPLKFLYDIDESIINCNKKQVDVIKTEYEFITGCSSNRLFINTEYEKKANNLQRLFIQNGYDCSVNKIKKRNYEYYDLIVLNPVKKKYDDVKRHTKIESVRDEKFWCVQTKNGNIIIRRNGRVCIVGNCHGTVPQYDRCMDVGIDNIGYYPIEFDDLIDLIKTKAKIEEPSKEQQMINEILPEANFSPHYFIGLCTGIDEIKDLIIKNVREGKKWKVQN